MMKQVSVRAGAKPFNKIQEVTQDMRGLEVVAQCSMIEQTVARAFDIAARELRAPTRRKAPVALARQVAMYLAHVAYGITLTEVGSLFGRDRTTAAHACRLVEDKRDDPAFDVSLDCLEAALRTWSNADLRRSAA